MRKKKWTADRIFPNITPQYFFSQWHRKKEWMFSILIQESPILCQPSLHHFDTAPTPESGAITPDMMPIVSPAFILISAIYGLLSNTLNLWIVL